MLILILLTSTVLVQGDIHANIPAVVESVSGFSVQLGSVQLVNSGTPRKLKVESTFKDLHLQTTSEVNCCKV